jgi:hypothetical protein
VLPLMLRLVLLLLLLALEVVVVAVAPQPLWVRPLAVSTRWSCTGRGCGQAWTRCGVEDWAGPHPTDLHLCLPPCCPQDLPGL